MKFTSRRHNDDSFPHVWPYIAEINSIVFFKSPLYPPFYVVFTPKKFALVAQKKRRKSSHVKCFPLEKINLLGKILRFFFFLRPDGGIFGLKEGEKKSQ